MSEQVKRYAASERRMFELGGTNLIHGEVLVVLASDYDALANEWRVATGENIMLRSELAEIRGKHDALRADVGVRDRAIEKLEQSVDGMRGMCSALHDSARAAGMVPGYDVTRLPERIGHLVQCERVVGLSGMQAILAERDDLRGEVDQHKVRIERQEQQIKTLQADPGSYKSGYDKGRADGFRHSRQERESLSAKVDQLQDELRRSEQALAESRGEAAASLP